MYASKTSGWPGSCARRSVEANALMIVTTTRIVHTWYLHCKANPICLSPLHATKHANARPSGGDPGARSAGHCAPRSTAARGSCGAMPAARMYRRCRRNKRSSARVASASPTRSSSARRARSIGRPAPLARDRGFRVWHGRGRNRLRLVVRNLAVLRNKEASDEETGTQPGVGQRTG